ncbi:nucleosome assembly protein [Cercophora scortea]|uniref:Nucleosome assembly protein n=1 Tax=Cercophora scortea TaxID=314031 RepID=A0AAE0IG81_9PEZI|nr:nucleosome assembly protein [Cercophora scortea]
MRARANNFLKFTRRNSLTNMDAEMADVSGEMHMESDSVLFVNALPAPVRERVEGLKSLQSEHDKVKARFDAQVRELEKKFASEYQPFFQQRAQIVNGQEGIPDFWLLALRNHPYVGLNISEGDEVALKALREIRSAAGNGADFQLTFEFGPNDCFTNTSLTKTYHYKEDPVTGIASPAYAVGDKIQWKAGRDLTQLTAESKSKDKTTKEDMSVDSFFDFFSPPAAAGSAEETDDTDEWERDIDFEIGEAIRDDIIPRAVSWYTGEAAEDQGFETTDDEGDDDDEDDDDDDDDLDGCGCGHAH